MGKSTISMAIFNSDVKLPEGSMKPSDLWHCFSLQPWVVRLFFTHVCLVKQSDHPDKPLTKKAWRTPVVALAPWVVCLCWLNS